MKSSTEQHRLGPVVLSPGVLPQHGWTFLYAAFVSIGLVTFVSIGQAYILNEHLKIPSPSRVQSAETSCSGPK